MEVVAPEKKPAAAQGADPASMVAIKVATVPVGAAIFVGDELSARGNAPLTLEFVRDEQTVVPVVARHRGYRRASAQVELLHSVAITLTLEPVAKRSTRGRKRGKKTMQVVPSKNEKSQGRQRRHVGDDILAPDL